MAQFFLLLKVYLNPPSTAQITLLNCTLKLWIFITVSKYLEDHFHSQGPRTFSFDLPKGRKGRQIYQHPKRANYPFHRRFKEVKLHLYYR